MFNPFNHNHHDDEEMHQHHPHHHPMHGEREGFRFGPRHGGPFGGGGPFGEGPFGGRPFGDGPFGKGGGPGRQRQRRGDVRFVLLGLLNDQPRHGYELIKALEERSGGFYRPSPGLVYPTLQLLEEEGNLTSEMVKDKKIYTITEAGKALLQSQNAEQEAERGPRWGRPQEADMPQMLELRRTSMALFESVMQAARYGTPAQVKAVLALLDTTNKEVHSILAQSAPSTTPTETV